jgi:chromosome segregation ATPase
MIQQMQQMAQQQQQLNQQIQQMLNETQGQRLTQDMQERLRQMSGQQSSLRNQLKELSRNREFRNKALGNLDRIAEQMQETIEELQQRNVNRQTVRRQQQILTRLLDATRSMQERGQEKRRESQEGRDFDRASPEELTPAEQADKLRRDLLRALEGGYAPDYEELIKRYFELLQEQSVPGGS